VPQKESPKLTLETVEETRARLLEDRPTTE
jgi:hypothetical protein